MPSPTRYEKTVIVGLPTVLGVALIVRLFAHGTVSTVALCVYLAGAVTMLAWTRRHSRLTVREPRRQRREQAILSVLADHPQGLYGLELSRQTRLGPGVLFPALVRIEERGLVRSWWGDGPEPRRRFYGLTDAGRDEHERA